MVGQGILIAYWNITVNTNNKDKEGNYHNLRIKHHQPIFLILKELDLNKYYLTDLFEFQYKVG